MTKDYNLKKKKLKNMKKKRKRHTIFWALE